MLNVARLLQQWAFDLLVSGTWCFISIFNGHETYKCQIKKENNLELHT